MNFRESAVNACGYRTGSGVAASNVGTNGNYWSETAGTGSKAYNWNLNNGNMNENFNAQTNGLSVRLFREESAPAGRERACLYAELVTDLRRAGLFARLPRSKSLHYAPPGVGLPIGNLTSQMFSNLYMNGFDQWVKRSLRVKHYGRYVDDTFYISTDREWLMGLVPQIDSYLHTHYGLRLNLRKTKLTEAVQGVSFLGICLMPHRRYVKRDTLQRMRQQVREMEAVRPRQLASEAVRQRLLAQANSMLGLLAHTRSYRQRCALFRHYPMFTFAYGARGMRKFKTSQGV